MLCLVLSQWRQTCVSSSSHRPTSNRTPKGSGSSTLDTERTTLSPSFTEPSWSDIHFFFPALHLSFTTSSPQRHAALGLCVLVWLLCFWILLRGTTNTLFLFLFFFHGPSGYIFINYGWDFKWLLCALNNILSPSFPTTLFGLCFLPPFLFFFLFSFFSQEEAINQWLNITFSNYQINTTLHLIQWTVFLHQWYFFYKWPFDLNFQTHVIFIIIYHNILQWRWLWLGMRVFKLRIILGPFFSLMRQNC